MVFALIAVGVKILVGSDGKQSPFSSLPVIVIFSAYITSYAIRIYIMNYYKILVKKKRRKITIRHFSLLSRYLQRLL